MQNETVGINFVNIPIEIFSSTELTANEKILYGYFSIFKKQCCFRSNEALANELGISVPTVTNAIRHLSELNYIYVEYVNNNNASRRIYALFDNPNKLKYLLAKGYLKSFPQSNKNYEPSHKNYEKSNKNYETPNGGDSHKNYEHKIIKDNKNIGSPGSAVGLPIQASEEKKGHERPNKSDFKTHDEWVDAFYSYNTIKLTGGKKDDE